MKLGEYIFSTVILSSTAWISIALPCSKLRVAIGHEGNEATIIQCNDIDDIAVWKAMQLKAVAVMLHHPFLTVHSGMDLNKLLQVLV